MARILVTGATGFIGARLVTHLAAQSHRVRAVVRRPAAAGAPRDVDVRVADIEQQPAWAELLAGMDAVIHLAGRAHIMRQGAEDPLSIARRANVEPTLELFRACRRAGIARFVYVSSVHVLGTHSGDQPLTESDPAAPADAYAQSKWEAECGLRQLSDAAAQLVVVRPAIVCGPQAKGNFARLVRLVARSLPLPFGAVRAERNLVGLTNLCDLLERCVLHPAAAGQTFLAADPETLSLPELIRTLAAALDRPARLLAVPPGLLMALGTLAGQRAAIERLTESLRVDASRARRELGWRNEVPLAEELARMARAAVATA